MSDSQPLDARTSWIDVAAVLHPAGKELELYVVGALEGPRVDAVAEHVAQCALCTKTVDALTDVYTVWIDESESSKGGGSVAAPMMSHANAPADAARSPTQPIPLARPAPAPRPAAPKVDAASGWRLSGLAWMATAATMTIATAVSLYQNFELKQQVTAVKRQDDARADALTSDLVGERSASAALRSELSAERRRLAALDADRRSADEPSSPRTAVSLLSAKPLTRSAAVPPVRIGNPTTVVVRTNQPAGRAFVVELFEADQRRLQMTVQSDDVLALDGRDGSLIVIMIPAGMLRPGGQYQLTWRSADGTAEQSPFTAVR